MDFFEIAGSRRSARAYRAEAVEDEKLAAILEAGRAAPTAANRQPFRVLVFETSGREAELRKIYDREWFAAAPLVLLICSVPAEAWSRSDGKNYADVDAAIAMDHIVLAATALGLGTCWVAAFDPAAAKALPGLEPGWEPLAFTPLGYPADAPPPRPRRAFGDLFLRS